MSPFLISGVNLQKATTTRRYWTARKKLDKVFNLLQEINWTMGDLLYYAFRVKDEDGHKIKKRSEAHAKMASRFLGGFCNCKYGLAEIVEIWVKSPWGIPNLKRGRWERNAMFSVEHEFRSLKPAKPEITPFVVQIVREQLGKDIQNAVKENGLHTFTTGYGDISDNYYGGQTMAETVELFKGHQVTNLSPGIFWLRVPFRKSFFYPRVQCNDFLSGISRDHLVYKVTPNP